MAKPGTDRDGAMVEKTTGKKVTTTTVTFFPVITPSSFADQSVSHSSMNILSGMWCIPVVLPLQVF